MWIGIISALILLIRICPNVKNYTKIAYFKFILLNITLNLFQGLTNLKQHAKMVRCWNKFSMTNGGKMKEYHILSLSGGKDSTALAFFMKENMPEIFEKTELVFCDTECELPELYDYLNKIEIFLNKKITYIKPPKSFEHLYDMYGHLPHPAKRWCTVELKTKPFQKYLKEKTDNFRVVTNLYIGIRKDEEHRTKTSTSKYQNIKEQFPFVEYGINKVDVFKILEESGINLPKFYSWKRRSGCYFCFFFQ